MPRDHALTVCSPAKINTFLHVYRQRADGYHNLLTHFQLVNLCDTLTFSVNDTGVINVNNPTVVVAPVDELCYRAAQCLKRYGKSSLGVNISVDKKIPDGGGLGGGSSNAATVLLVLNRLWQIFLPPKELLALGLALGSDVPFFIHGQSTVASGRGEVFVADGANNGLANKSIVIVNPKQRVATAGIFQSQALKKRDGVGAVQPTGMAPLIEKGENDFAAVVFHRYPRVYQAFKRLSAYSPAHLTGTGACVYTVLDEDKKADKIVRGLSDEYQVFLVRAMSTSPLNRFKIGV